MGTRGNGTRPCGVALARMMGGLWTKNCRHRTDQGPPITDLELPHRVRRSGTILQARLPTFCPAKRAPPSPASPPDPASGPRDGGDAMSMRGGVGAGIRWISRRMGPQTPDSRRGAIGHGSSPCSQCASHRWLLVAAVAARCPGAASPAGPGIFRSVAATACRGRATGETELSKA